MEDFCNHIHRSLVKDVKYVLVWGISARHYPQHCGLGHVLQDEDVVQIVKKKVNLFLHLAVQLIVDRHHIRYLSAIDYLENQKILGSF